MGSFAIWHLLFVAGYVAVWFLPSLIALKRDHSSKWGILAATIIFGWIPLIWPVILIWSLSGRHHREPVTNPVS
ncbi:superinfection immunity protein [Azospirillum melinis]